MNSKRVILLNTSENVFKGIVKGDGYTNSTIRIKNSTSIFTHKDGFYKSSFDLVFRKTDFGGILLLGDER
jgi:hypothetical protein